MKCEKCNSEMSRQAAFLKCINKKCELSQFGIRANGVKINGPTTKK